MTFHRPPFSDADLHAQIGDELEITPQRADEVCRATGMESWPTDEADHTPDNRFYKGSYGEARKGALFRLWAMVRRLVGGHPQ